MELETTAVLPAPVAGVPFVHAAKPARAARRAVLPYGLLAASLAFFALAHVPFISVEFPSDEGENLLGGWLMSQGQVIYRDYFAQHAPFGHFYSAAFECLFPGSWAVHRWSVALLGLFTFAYLQCRLLKNTDRTLFWAAVLLTFLWPFYSVIYWGFMLLNDNLAAYACLLPFTLLFNAIWNRATLTRADHVVIGVSAYVAVFSIPFAVFPLLAAAPVYAGLLRRQRSQPGIPSAWTPLALAGFGFGVPAILTGLYFAKAHALSEAWDCVVTLNSQVFPLFRGPKAFSQAVYQGHTPSFWAPFAHQLTSIFDLLAGAPWDFRPAITEPSVGWGNDWWAYSGLAGRLSLLGVCAYAVATRRLTAAAFLYVFAAAALIRTNEGFHAQPFRLLELFAAAFLTVAAVNALFRCSTLTRLAAIFPLLALIAVHLIVAGRAAATVKHTGVQLTLHPTGRTSVPEPQFVADVLRDGGKLFCPPVSYQANYQMGRQPPGYHFACVPWTVRRKQDLDRLLTDLHRAADGPAVVWLGRPLDIWGIPFEYFAKDVVATVERDYIEMIPNLYLSRSHPAAKRPGLATVEVPVRPAEIRDVAWAGDAGVCQAGRPELRFRFAKPGFVHRIEIRFVLTSDSETPARFQICWTKDGSDRGSRLAETPTGTEERLLSLPVHDVADGFRIEPGGPCHVQIRSIRLVVPAEAAASEIGGG